MDSKKFISGFCFLSLHFFFFSSTFSQSSMMTKEDDRAGSLRKAIIADNNIVGPDTIAFSISQADAGFFSSTSTRPIQVGTKLPGIKENETIIDATTQPNDTDISVIGVITTTADSGEGSLRNAIIMANNNVGPDSIIFNIPQSDPGFSPLTGTWIIQPHSELPIITDDVTIIDAMTQPAYIDKPLIELNGSQVDSANGFSIISSNNIIKGFVINGFKGKYDSRYGKYDLGTGLHVKGKGNLIIGNFIGTDVTGYLNLGNESNGIKIIGGHNIIENNLISGNGSGIYIVEGERNVIIGNLIGTDVSGALAIENQGRGITIYGRNTIVGGLSPDARNIISGNGGDGIYAYTWKNNIVGNYIGTDITGSFAIPNKGDGIDLDSYSSYNVIEKNVISGNDWDGIEHGAFYGTVFGTTSHCQIFGNYIGTDVTGTIEIGNNGYGVRFGFNTIDNLVGGSDEAKRNIISGNGRDGIYIDAGRRHKIIGNYIGTDVTGENDFGNGRSGITIEYDDVGGLTTEGYYNKVGGFSLEEGNLIRFNERHGIQIWDKALQNLISHNAISQNNEHGIDNFLGGNLELQPPTIISPDTTMEFMPTIIGTALPQINIELFIDPHPPHDEGFVFLGSTASDPNGNWQIKTTSQLEKGENFLTATAIDGDNNTSEFSKPFIVFTPAPDISVTKATLDFGDVVLGDSSKANFAINNTGNDTLAVSNISSSEPQQFFVSHTAFNIAPGDSQMVTVIFKPGFEGLREAVLTIASNDPNQPSLKIQLKGNGVILNPPINLSAFESSDTTVILKWEKHSTGKTPLTNESTGFGQRELAILESFNIYRSVTSPVQVKEQNKIGDVDANTTTFIDTNITVGNTYFYVVTAVYDQGESGPSNEASTLVTAAAQFMNSTLPETFALSQNYPNPFNPETTIQYKLPGTSQVELVIYNLAGQRVATLVNRRQPGGIHFVRWNGKDDSGRNVASGVYLYRLETKEFVQIRKMALVR